jgi:hypothetical protein
MENRVSFRRSSNILRSPHRICARAAPRGMIFRPRGSGWESGTNVRLRVDKNTIRKATNAGAAACPGT